MSIQKHPYELSIWEEHLGNNGIKSERRLATIGSSNMTYGGKATEIELKKEIKGTNTLTFKMPSKFFDSEKGEYVKNEFIDMLYNEQKVKLFYKDSWLEFYVKQISEEKNFKSLMKTFTCQDSFIDELSRTGYGITFDEELYNNVDELGVFMNTILEDSVWDYKPELNTGDFTEFKEERFYKIPLSQFGGKIKAYPITLNVKPENFNKESEYYKSVIEKDGKFDELKEATLTNIFTDEERALELGDDSAREKEIFWDNYYKDNGFKLLDDSKMIELSGDYIYVPYSDLSFIYGNVYTNAYKATEEPALYGNYEENKNNKQYALQPKSKSPTDLIQFIFFKNGDKILIDESGTVVNNDCHYVIKVSQWNKALKEQLKNKDTLIYWATAAIPEESKLTTKYELKTDGDITYSVNVKPNTRTIDDFTWYPVYYDGYMEELGDNEVYAARKISITDRTEFNLNSEIYCKIYNNKAEEYENIYSEKEINEIIKTDVGKDFRVCSKDDTRIILPTLAKNLVQNGEKITKETGWESLTQNDTSEYNIGSYANLLEVSVKSTNELTEEATGETIDENISDFYLEILSPNIVKGYDMDLEGTVSSDYCLNFGLSANEINIEKDKVYAIRISTGNWIITDYSITFRNNTENTVHRANEDEKELYTKALESYNDFLLSCDLKELTTESSEDDFKNYLKNAIAEYDKNISELYSKWANCNAEDDYNYLIYRAYTNEKKDIPKDKQNSYVELTADAYKTWATAAIIENKVFTKNYNVDLDKIIIGQGSVDINGNYTLSGVSNRQDTDKFISFADIFEDMNTLTFVPFNDKSNSDAPLTTTLHYKKKNGTWTWDEIESPEADVPDNAYLLFKAKANITTPYIGIRSDSEPMTVSIDSTKAINYGETDYSGVKLELWSEGEDNNSYLVDKAEVKIYKVDNKNFSDKFLEAVGWKIEDSGSSGGQGDNDGSIKAKGIDVSEAQGKVNWKKVKESGKVDFVIIRAGYGKNSVDEQFNSNTLGCAENGIPYGIYWYSYAQTAEDAVEEAKKCIKTIKDKNLTYPVFYDVEESSNINSINELSVAFCEYMKSQGYSCGIYSFASGLESVLSTENKEKYPIWAAQFGTNGKLTAYTGKYVMFQYSCTGRIDGITGNVDLDYCYETYKKSTTKKVQSQQLMLFAANDDNEKEDENKKDENTETYDYTLNDGDLLTDAKPVWKGTTSSIDPLFFNVMLPKNNDTKSMAYALFINDYYYGIFWLEQTKKETEDKDEEESGGESS